MTKGPFEEIERLLEKLQNNAKSTPDSDRDADGFRWILDVLEDMSQFSDEKGRRDVSNELKIARNRVAFLIDV